MTTVNATESLQWVMHCDTQVYFFGTEDEALAAAEAEIRQCKNASKGPGGVWDGWDEHTVERICVMRIAHRAKQVNPDVPYQLVEYEMRRLPHHVSGEAIEFVLERWDQTEPALQRQIAFAFMQRCVQLERELKAATANNS